MVTQPVRPGARLRGSGDSVSGDPTLSGVVRGFERMRLINDLTPGDHGSIQLVDLDGDESLEVILAGSTKTAAVASGDNRDGIEWFEDHPLSSATEVRRLPFGDVDGDGIVDAVVAGTAAID